MPICQEMLPFHYKYKLIKVKPRIFVSINLFGIVL